MQTPDIHILRNTAEVWQHIHAEFGLLSAADVGRMVFTADVCRSSPDNAVVQHCATQYYEDIAKRLHDNGSILKVARKGVAYYPAFQFDAGRPLPVMRKLKRIAEWLSISDATVLQWMTAPTTWWDDSSRPVDHMHDVESICASFEQHYGMEW